MHQKKSNNLSEFLVSSRTKDSKSLREYADYLGISHTYLSNLEKGESKNGIPISPSIDTLIKIATRCNIPVEKFFKICGFTSDNENFTVNYTNSDLIDLKKYIYDFTNNLNSMNLSIEGVPINQKELKIIKLYFESIPEFILKMRNIL